MISVCIIMKNEEKFIDEMLKRLLPYNCEIVIVDTGSTDRSIEIAKKYTDKIYSFDWINDFSAARNFSISKASNDLVFILDCDEFIENCDFSKVYACYKKNPYSIGYIRRLSKFTQNGLDYISNEDIPRIFSRKYFHYEGSIHEQVRENEGVSQEQYDADIVVTHAGYDGEETVKKKAYRNIDMLLKEYSKNQKDPYILYQLGKSYYVLNDYKNASLFFEKCADLKPDTQLSYVNEMYNTYAYSLINLNKIAECKRFLDMYEELAVTADFVFVVGLIYMNMGKFSESIFQFKKALTMKNAKIEGTNSYAASYNIGVIYECIGDTETALSFYKKCGNYAPALKGIERIKKA